MTKFEDMFLWSGCPKCESINTYEVEGNINGDECRFVACEGCDHIEIANLWDDLSKVNDEIASYRNLVDSKTKTKNDEELEEFCVEMIRKLERGLKRHGKHGTFAEK